MSLKVATLAGLALAVSAPAGAMSSAEIRIADLDLSTSHGFVRLSQRIDRAADEICGRSPGGIGARYAGHTCRIEVRRQAHERLRDRITAAPVRMAGR